MANVYWSDTHFNHGHIIPFCHRPFKNLEEMNFLLFEEMLKADLAGHTIYHCGDLGMDIPQLLYRYGPLPHADKHVLISGNHEKPTRLISALSIGPGSAASSAPRILGLPIRC